MKTTRMIAGAALAGLLVIGPLTMTRAHDFPWPGPFSFPLTGTQVASASGETFLSVDLRADGLSASALGEAIETTVTDDGIEVKRLSGVYHTAILTKPGSAYAALIQIDVRGRANVVAHMLRNQGHVIILVLEPERSQTTMTVAGLDDGLDPQAASDAVDAVALLYASGTSF